MATLQDIADRLNISKGTVSKALNDAPDISETLQKTILETAVEMGYTKIRRQKAVQKKLCILIENMDYKEPHQFGYEIILGFRQLAEPAGYVVDIIDTTISMQQNTPYDVFMLQHQYLGAFVVGFSLDDPWMKDFLTSRTPAVLYDNYITTNPNTAYVGIDNLEGMELAVSHLKNLGHKKIGYLCSELTAHIMKVRHNAFLQALEQNQRIPAVLITLLNVWKRIYQDFCSLESLPSSAAMTRLPTPPSFNASSLDITFQTISVSSVSMTLRSVPTLRLL